MRTVLACLALVVCSSVSLAETITTTDGKKYTKAKDGQFYPADKVTADGHVMNPTLTSPSCRTCGPICPCPSGVCPACPPVGRSVPYSVKPQGGIIQLPTAPSCPGGNCPVPGRPPLLRRFD